MGRDFQYYISRDKEICDAHFERVIISRCEVRNNDFLFGGTYKATELLEIIQEMRLQGDDNAKEFGEAMYVLCKIYSEMDAEDYAHLENE